MQDKKLIAIADLYPDFSKEELEEAEVNLRRYLAVLLRMSERLEGEGRTMSDIADCQFDDSPDHR